MIEKVNAILQYKDVMQGKLFQKCTHLFYCSVLSLGGNVNTRRMSKPVMESIFHIKNQWNILVIGNYYLNYQNYQNVMLLTSSDTKQTRMHLILLTYSAQIELVSICTQIIHTTEINFPCIIALNFCHNFQISYYLERATDRTFWIEYFGSAFYYNWLV